VQSTKVDFAIFQRRIHSLLDADFATLHDTHSLLDADSATPHDTHPLLDADSATPHDTHPLLDSDFATLHVSGWLLDGLDDGMWPDLRPAPCYHPPHPSSRSYSA
jgi:hypothetical protein